jgi:hypothetical protein
MGTVGIIALLLGIFVLGGMWNIWRKNKDPKQQELCRLLVAAGRCAPQDTARATMQIRVFMADQGWDRVEMSRRVAHAMTLLEHSAPRDDYESAQKLWQSFVKGEW